MKVRVLFFATCREIVGAREAVIEIDEGSTVSDLVANLAAAHPRFGEVKRGLMVSVGQEYAEGECLLVDGDEVAFIPPVRGG